MFPNVDATQTLADFRAGIDRVSTVARETPWLPTRSPLTSIVGLMQGELEYRDYTSGRRTRIPSWLHTSPIGASGAFRLRTIYDDGPCKTLYSVDEVRLTGRRWTEGNGDTLRVVNSRALTNSTVLTLLGSGIDDNQAVHFRYTVSLASSGMRRLKEFRVRGKPFAYRHEYRYQRQPRSQEAKTPTLSR